MAESKAKDPFSEMVKIKLPKAAKGEDNFLIASVNGRIFKVQKGVEVEVPAPIAEVIEHSFAAQDEADDFIASKSGE